MLRPSRLPLNDKRLCKEMQSRCHIHAAEWSRTITGVSTHKALNLARLPVPPQPLVGPGILGVRRARAVAPCERPPEGILCEQVFVCIQTGNWRKTDHDG